MYSKLFCVLVFASVLDARLNSRAFRFGGGPDCEIPSIEHGKVRTRPRSRVIRYTCLNKYTLVGNRYATCKNGAWDEPTPVCIKSSPSCEVNAVENGIVVPTHDDAYITFFCLPEYKMVGNRIMYCDGRRWVGEPPKCINSTSPPLLACDFESPDLCGWRQDEFHDFDWRRWNKKTPSSVLKTGPEFDHTLGVNQSGFYMYIESSSQAENSSARLLSPIYDRKLAVDGCFKFYYHMFGASTGGLRIFQKPDNLSLSNLMSDRYKYMLFEKWGNQGNEWMRYSARLNDFGDDFQIVIEGIRGPAFLSDIAIDDVELMQGENCTETILYTTTSLPIESCANRCMQSDTDANTFCGCSIDCILNGNCCPDFYDICIFADHSGVTFPYDDLPSVSNGEKMPQTEKLVGTTPSNTTEKELPINITTTKLAITTTTPKTTVTTTKTDVTTLKTNVTAMKTNVTLLKNNVTTIKPVTTTVKTVTIPIPTTSTTKKSIPKLVFKSTEPIFKHEDAKTTTEKTVTSKPVTVKAATTKPVIVTTGPPAKIVTLKLTTVKTRLTTVLNKRRSSDGVKTQNRVSNEWTSKDSGISTTSIVFLLLGLTCLVGSAVWFLRSARACHVIADLRGRSTRDQEVRYLTSHVDED